MTEITLIAAGLAATAAALIGWGLAELVDPSRRQVLANLNRGRNVVAAPRGDDSRPAPESTSAIAAFARRVTPPPVLRMLHRQHLLAVRPQGWAINRLLVMKMLWVPVAALVVFGVLRSELPPLFALIIVVMAIALYFYPEIKLNSDGATRNEKIQYELADTLDQMTISVEAGLGFDAAMQQAARNGKGPLAEELRRTLQDIQIGRSRRQAFESLTQRTSVPDLRRFVRAVVQADAYGISIADVLRTQAKEMRLKRRQRAEEAAQKIPVKVLMPLMLFILPVLFIVVLGPAVINMVAAFSGM